MSNTFAGVWPAMVTPLNENGQPAFAQIDALVELFVKQRLGGIYILGSSGQGLLLSREERQAVAERVVQAAAGRIPVMVHVGAITTAEAVQLAKHACDIGAAAVASIGPVYYPLDADCIFEHYRRIGAAGSLPFFVYQIDLVNQPKLSPSQYVSRVLEIPKIAGIKLTSSDLYQLGLVRNYSDGRLALFSGTDQLLCHAALSGAVGAIGFFFNLWGAECRAAHEALRSGQSEAAARFMLAFQRVTYEFHALGAWSHLRRAMQLRFDIDIGQPRAPLATVVPPLDERRLAELLETMELASCEIEAASALNPL